MILSRDELLIFDIVASLLLLFLATHYLFGAQELKSEHKRSQMIDFMKGICIWQVVFFHALDLVPISSAVEVKNFIIALSPLRLFFIASGYMLMVRYADNFSGKVYFRLVFLRIFLPYVIYTAFAALFLKQRDNFGDFFLDVLLGRQNHFSLYFIPLLIQCYILFPLIRAARNLLLNPFSLALIMLFSFLVYQLNESTQQNVFGHNILSLAFCGRFLFYFILGASLAKFDFEKGASPRHFWLFAGGYTVYILAFFSLGYTWDTEFILPLFSFLGAIELYHHLKSIPSMERPLHWLSNYGKYSLVIYFLHAPVLFHFFAGFHNSLPLSLSVKYVFISTVSTLACYAIGKPLMIGYHGAVKKLQTASASTI